MKLEIKIKKKKKEREKKKNRENKKKKKGQIIRGEWKRNKTHGESAAIRTDAFACCTELGTTLSFPELPPPTLEANAPVVKRTPRARYSFGILRPRMRLLFSYFSNFVVRP